VHPATAAQVAKRRAEEARSGRVRTREDNSADLYANSADVAMLFPDPADPIGDRSPEREVLLLR